MSRGQDRNHWSDDETSTRFLRSEDCTSWCGEHFFHRKHGEELCQQSEVRTMRDTRKPSDLQIIGAMRLHVAGLDKLTNLRQRATGLQNKKEHNNTKHKAHHNRHQTSRNMTMHKSRNTIRNCQSLQVSAFSQMFGETVRLFSFVALHRPHEHFT